jgi:hypothetical protein
MLLGGVLFAAAAWAQTAGPPAHADTSPAATSVPQTTPAAPAPATTPAAPVPEGEAMHSFGNANPDCLEWTDACQVCLRDQDGVQQCSTPGIACTPSVPVVCRVKKRVRPAAPPAESPPPADAPAPPPAGK